MQPSASAFAIGWNSWRTGLGAFLAQPRLLFSGLLVVWAIHAAHITFVAGTGYDSPLLALIPVGLFLAVVSAMAVGVMRRVLQGPEPASVRDRPIWWGVPHFWRFFLAFLLIQILCVALPVIFLIGVGLVLFGSSLSTALGTFGAVGVMFLAYLVVVIGAALALLRSVLLFPAIAIGAPGAGWRQAWQDSRGHGWKILGTYCWVFLPVAVLACAVLVFHVTKLAPGSEAMLKPTAMTVLVQLASSAFGYAVTVVSAVAAARLFQIYANRLNSAAPAPEDTLYPAARF